MDEYEGLLARNYDALYAGMRGPSNDAAFYRELARESGGPVLEVGCGTGRVLLPIAALGVPCVGVDPSPAMLAALRAKNPPPTLELVEGRMQTFDLGGRRVPLVTCPFRAFQHLLTVDAQLAALANIRRHLAPGGAFAFDVFDPKLAWLGGAADDASASTPRSRSTASRRAGFASVRSDRRRRSWTVTFRFEAGADRRQHHRVGLRWFYRYEIEHLLARAGFTDLTFYGGYDRRPWRPKARR
jgi:ubiquinone/menaquinone biosynthesis C-methylase UbiE